MDSRVNDQTMGKKLSADAQEGCVVAVEMEGDGFFLGKVVLPVYSPVRYYDDGMHLVHARFKMQHYGVKKQPVEQQGGGLSQYYWRLLH